MAEEANDNPATSIGAGVGAGAGPGVGANDAAAVDTPDSDMSAAPGAVPPAAGTVPPAPALPTEPNQAGAHQYGSNPSTMSASADSDMVSPQHSSQPSDGYTGGGGQQQPEGDVPMGAGGAGGGAGATEWPVGAGAGAGVGVGAGAGATPEYQGSDSKHSMVDGKGMAPWRLHLDRGTLVDVLDTRSIWCEAEVAEADPDDDMVMIHFLYWSSAWDELLPRSSPRIAQHGSRAYVKNGTLRAGQRIEVFDEHPAKRVFMEASVLSVTATHVRVHFIGWTSRWDEDLPLTSSRIAPIGTQTRERRYYRPNATRYWAKRKRQRYLARNDPRISTYRDHMLRAGLRIMEVQGDGNCLFRSVSHQIYGNDSYHHIVRARCCDYMEREKEWFSAFVVGSMPQFMAYLARKRTLGEWGDDPEIQAMSELYDRRTEIYVYSPDGGYRLLRTLHEGTGDAKLPTIRLSYYGGGHYDSIVAADTEAHFVKEEPGALEARRIVAGGAVSKERRSAATAEEMAAIEEALKRSREAFDDKDVNLEAALIASMGGDPASVIAPGSSAAASSRGGGGSSVPNPDADLQAALQASLAIPQDPDEALALALARSMQHTSGVAPTPTSASASASSSSGGGSGGGGGGGNGGDPDAELARALAASMAQAQPPNAGTAGTGTPMTGLDDDEELQLALAMSAAGDAAKRAASSSGSASTPAPSDGGGGGGGGQGSG